MSKTYNIRWKQSDNEDVRKTVKNFNAKISRTQKKLQKQHDESSDANERLEIRRKMSALPEKVTTKELKEVIHTRQDLKRELNSLKRFTQQRGVEYTNVPGHDDSNMKITKWQKNEMFKRITNINKKRQEKLEQIKNIPVTSRGEKTGYTKGDIGMGKADEVALMPLLPFTKKMSRADLNEKFKAIRKESSTAYWKDKEAQLKENVMKGIKANYGSLFPEETEKILEAIEDMDFDEFYQTFMGESGEMELVSPPPGADLTASMRINLEGLKSTWIPNYQTSMDEEVDELKKEMKEKYANLTASMRINLEALKSTWIPNYQTSMDEEVDELKKGMKEKYAEKEKKRRQKIEERKNRLKQMKRRR